MEISKNSIELSINLASKTTSKQTVFIVISIKYLNVTDNFFYVI